MWECGSVVILNYYHCLITKDAINFYKDILGSIFTSSVILVLATAPPSLERGGFFTTWVWSQHKVWQISWQRPPFVWGHLSSAALQLCSPGGARACGGVAARLAARSRLLLSRPGCTGAQARVATSHSYHHHTAYIQALWALWLCSSVSSHGHSVL